jgi:hypothetical protein
LTDINKRKKTNLEDSKCVVLCEGIYSKRQEFLPSSASCLLKKFTLNTILAQQSNKEDEVQKYPRRRIKK